MIRKSKPTTRLMIYVPLALLAAELTASAVLPIGLQKPKHYVYVADDFSFTNNLKIMTNANISGVQVRYYWKDIEVSSNVYNTSLIEAHRNALAARGKGLVIQIQDKSFSTNINPVPNYLTTNPQYNGGVYINYASGNDGEITARRWDPALLPRYDALFMALSNQFCGRIDGIVLPETAMNIDSSAPPAGYNSTTYQSGYSNMVTRARANFPGPTNSVILYANFMAGGIQPVVNHCANIGVGVGGPDILVHAESSSATGVESAYQIWRTKKGIVPLAAAVQWADYVFIDPATGQSQSMEATYEYATNSIKLDVIFWQVREPWFSKTNLSEFNVLDTIAAHPSGGNAPAAPTSLGASEVSSNQIDLTWSDVADETGFRLWRSQSNGGPYGQVGGDLAAGVTNYTDAPLPSGTTYYYVVTAFNTNGSSVNSPQAQATTQAVVTNDPSLVLHWRLDETGGTSAADATGNGHTGTLVGGPTWVTGQFSNALNFTGANHITTPDTNDLKITGAMTLTAWLKMNAVVAGFGALISKKDVDYNGAGYELLYNGSPAEIRVRGGGGDSAKALGANLGTGWHHVAAVISGTTCTIYMDGTNVTTDTILAGLSASTNALRTGQNAYGGGGLNGAVDGVRIYTRALSQSEVQALLVSDDSVGAVPPPEPPMLSVASSGGQMTMNWSNAVFRLHAATNLVPPVEWTLWPGTLTTNGGMVSTIIPASQNKQFFRLTWP